MQIVIDKRVPEEAKAKLAAYGNLIEFCTAGICYSAISGHPDIFFTQYENTLICAPNTPTEIINQINKRYLNVVFGDNEIVSKFPQTAFYNALITEKYIFHKNKYTDASIPRSFPDKAFINIPQAYTRCNLIELPGGVFITSDKGIEKTLRQQNFEVAYFSPNHILLPGMPNGFIGGALGSFLNKLFIIGNPSFHSWGSEFISFVKKQKLEMICLYDGPFFDGGGILFLE
ncbi:MAG: hypothetical protein V1783_09645 [Bacteroidota bacterium]